MSWFVYLVRCKDNSLYCGITNDVGKRMLAHNSGKGAKYTKTRRPIHLVYMEVHTDKSHAAKREWFIKHSLSKKDKEALVRKYNE